MVRTTPPLENEPLARAGQPDVRNLVTRTDPREPEQPTLPPRLDPRAGRPRTSASGGGGRSGLGKLAAGTRVVAALAAAAILGTSGWGWYLGEVADSTVNRTDAIPTNGNVDQFDGGAMNLLLVGSDSRANLTPELASQLSTGTVAGQNTDTMIMVHVPADGSAASFVSFPRDSYVDIPGYGMDKLNAAYAYGYNAVAADKSEKEKQAAGAQLLIQTISKLSGVKIDHYAEVDLLGFFKLSNVVGGVEVNLCAPAKDSYSGIDLPAGKQTIKGEQALAFVRQRHGLLRGDYDRIVRQQTFIGSMIRKMLAQDVLLDLGKQRKLVTAAADALTVDRSLNLMNLASQMQSVSAGDINFQTIPMVGDGRDDQGRFITELPDEATMHAFFRDLTADPEPTKAADPSTPAAPKTVAPSAITVDVYNGSGIAGLAASASTDLTAKGFVAGATGNADSSDYTVTEIRHAPGEEALANTVLASVPGASVVESDEVPAGTVHLVLGSDFKGVGQKVAPVSAPAASSSAAKPRTAADTACIN
jgi:LCP family protein required for cell wall assembly